jgi:hypothetical protein
MDAIFTNPQSEVSLPVPRSTAEQPTTSDAADVEKRYQQYRDDIMGEGLEPMSFEDFRSL